MLPSSNMAVIASIKERVVVREGRGEERERGGAHGGLGIAADTRWRVRKSHSSATWRNLTLTTPLCPTPKPSTETAR